MNSVNTHTMNAGSSSQNAAGSSQNAAGSSSKKGKAKGRKKIPLQKIEGRSNLEVSFSKRRPGLFKKASELSIICGCEVAIVVFTMLNKMFAFGSPSAESIFNKFLQEQPGQDALEQMVESECGAEIEEMSRDMAYYHDVIRASKNELHNMQEALKDRDQQDYNKYWWLKPVNEMSNLEAHGMLAKLEYLEKKFNPETSPTMI